MLPTMNRGGRGAIFNHLLNNNWKAHNKFYTYWLFNVYLYAIFSEGIGCTVSITG